MAKATDRRAILLDLTHEEAQALKFGLDLIAKRGWDSTMDNEEIGHCSDIYAALDSILYP